MDHSKILFNLIPILTVAAMFAMVGCDDSSTGPGPENALVGSWKLTSRVIYYGSSVANADSSEDWTPFMGNRVFTFNADGTGQDVRLDEDGTETSRWTYTATTTEITIHGDGEPEVVTFEVSGNTLTITKHEAAEAGYNDPEAWIVSTLTKQ